MTSFALILIAAFTSSTTTVAPSADGKPKLRVDETRWSWGSLIQGEFAEHTFTLHNDGDAPLEITNALPSCGCLEIEYPKTPIAAGATGRVKVKIDSSRLLGADVLKMVTIMSNDRRRGPTHLEVQGEVRALLLVEPKDLVGRAFPGERPRVEILFRPATEFGGKVVAVRLPDTKVTTTLTPLKDDATRLVIEREAQDQPQQLGLSFELDVLTNDGKTRTTALSARIEYRARWQLSTRRLLTFVRDDVQRLVDDPKAIVTKELLVEAGPEDYRFEVLEARLAKPIEGLFDISVEPLEPGRRYRVKVRLLRVPQARLVRSKLVVRTDDPTTPEQQINLRAFGATKK